MIVYYDLETTGLNYKKHSPHQIAGIVEVAGKEVERFNIKTCPNPKAVIEKEALSIAGVTEEEILKYPTMFECYLEFTSMLDKYIDKYDRTNKAWLVGFNNKSFDDFFLRAWFEQNKDKFFNSWFWSDTQDTMVLASLYLMDERHKMGNFKLSTVAKYLGIKVDKTRLHDAFYDVELTRQIYKIVTL